MQTFEQADKALKYMQHLRYEKAKITLLKRRVITANACWIWQGCKFNSGYGQIVVNQEHWLVHRLSAGLFKPEEYKDYLDVLHTCDTPLCFNPEHLFIGSQSDNTIDCVNKGRHYLAAKTHCQNGHELSGSNLYLEPKTGSRRCKICRSFNDAMRIT